MPGAGIEVGAIYATIEARGWAKFAGAFAQMRTELEKTKAAIKPVEDKIIGFADDFANSFGVQGVQGKGIADAFAKQFEGITGKGAGKGKAGNAGGFLPEHIQSTVDQLTKMRRPITVMQRDFNRLGGEMTKGLNVLGTVFQHAIGKQMEPQLRVLQRDMIDHIAKLRGWGPATTGAVKGIVAIHSELGKWQKRQELINTLFGQFFDSAKKGFYLLTGSVMGFVAAGLRGTQEGNALAYRFQLLSQQIAAIFLPIIDKVIDYLGRIVSWFQNLSGEQQDNIRKWILIAAGILGVIAHGRLLAALLQGLYLGIKLLGSGILAIATNPWAAAIAGAGVLLLLIMKMHAAAAELRQRMEDVLKSQQDMTANMTRADLQQDKFYQKIAQMKANGASREEIANAVIDERNAAMRQIRQGEAAIDAAGGGEGKQGVADFENAMKNQESAQKRLDVANKVGGEFLDNTKFTGGRDLKKNRMDVSPVFGGFEDVGKTFDRIQQSILQKDFSQLTADATRETADNTKMMAERLNQLPITGQPRAVAVRP